MDWLIEDRPVDFAHRKGDEEACGDAEHDGAHAEEFVFGAVEYQDDEKDDCAEQKVERVAEGAGGVCGGAAAHLVCAKRDEREADHDHGDTGDRIRNDFFEVFDQAAADHDEYAADEACAEERRHHLIGGHAFVVE